MYDQVTPTEKVTTYATWK